MSTGRQGQAWFERMRRDGALFALVCALLLVGNLFQPLAQARAAGLDAAWAICTTHGVEGVGGATSGDAPAHDDDCPLCLTANHCGGIAAPKLIATAVAAFDPPHASRSPTLAPSLEVAPDGLPGDPPPAIRAPPLSA